MTAKNVTITTAFGETVHFEEVSETFILTLFQMNNRNSSAPPSSNMDIVTDSQEEAEQKKTLPVVEETYYQKRKKDAAYVEATRRYARERYLRLKDDPEFKAKAKAASQKFHKNKKEKKQQQVSTAVLGTVVISL
jgi:hypothetical protein